jgi:hypothetical protein
VSAERRIQDHDRNGDTLYLTSRVLQARADRVVSFGILFKAGSQVRRAMTMWRREHGCHASDSLACLPACLPD